MPVIMHFSTFLKLLTLDTGDKIRKLENYAKPGGFDFYRPSREGVSNYSAYGKSKTDVISDIETISTQTSVAHNVEIFEYVSRWLDKQPGLNFAPSRGVWASPNNRFSVHIEPEIGIEKGSSKRVLAVYPRRDPRLNRAKAGAGMLLLKKAYKGSGHEEFGILDAYGERAHGAPTNVSSTLLNLEIATIEAELTRIMGYPPVLGPVPPLPRQAFLRGGPPTV